MKKPIKTPRRQRARATNSIASPEAELLRLGKKVTDAMHDIVKFATGHVLVLVDVPESARDNNFDKIVWGNWSPEEAAELSERWVRRHRKSVPWQPWATFMRPNNGLLGGFLRTRPKLKKQCVRGARMIPPSDGHIWTLVKYRSRIKLLQLAFDVDESELYDQYDTLVLGAADPE